MTPPKSFVPLRFLMIAIAPTGKFAQEAVLKLNNKFGENYLTKGKVVFSTSGDNFEELETILRNQLPLRKAYTASTLLIGVSQV
jgi:hypothetical protein